MGEPIAVAVQIENNGPRDILIFRPDSLGFSKTISDDPDAIDINPPPVVVGGRLGAMPTRLKHGESVKGWAIVNKDIRFQRAKAYQIKIPVGYRDADAEGMDRANWKRAVFETGITIEEGPARPAVIEDYIREADTSRFAFEMLVWSSDPRALPRIVETIKFYGNDMPVIIRDICQKLPNDDVMRAIGEIAKGSKFLIYSATSSIHEKGSIVAKDVLRSWINSLSKGDAESYVRDLKKRGQGKYDETFKGFENSADKEMAAFSKAYFSTE